MVSTQSEYFDAGKIDSTILERIWEKKMFGIMLSVSLFEQRLDLNFKHKTGKVMYLRSFHDRLCCAAITLKLRL